MFDRNHPDDDPPVYSETPGINFTFGFHDFHRRYSREDASYDHASRQQDAETVESQLELEHGKLSIFLEKYATEAKNWDMDDANSSLQDEQVDDLLFDPAPSDCSSESGREGKPRRSKRLKEYCCPPTDELVDEFQADTDDEIVYEDFGLRFAQRETPRKQQGGVDEESSSGEEEWQDETT